MLNSVSLCIHFVVHVECENSLLLAASAEESFVHLSDGVVLVEPKPRTAISPEMARRLSSTDCDI